ncbi:hypothetical protein MXD81_42795 [Microbacteriaceae bacterium K1510]|nr:hypothetical protein [Microbacteriaceae bacterium K1510]
MLKKFAVALVAASLLAGPALAQGNGSAVSAPVTHTKTIHKSSLNTHAPKKHVAHRHAAKKHVVHKHVAKKHIAKHHAIKKTHVSKAKRMVKPVHKTLG